MAESPRNLDEYGKSSASVVARNYMDSVLRGAPITKALVLKGKQGVGKTTLVRAVAGTYGCELVETNASLDRSKKSFHRFINAGQTAGDSRRILFFDEADGLTKTQQKYLIELLQNVKCPVFIACNSAMERDLNDLCMVLEVLPVRGNGSYRLAQMLALGGEKLEHEDDPEQLIANALRGGEQEVPPGAWWMVNTTLLDNTQGGEPMAFDLWQSRYRKVGSDMAKYVQRSLRLGLRQVDRPWSLKLRWGGSKVVKPVKDKPKRDEPALVAAPPPKPVVAQADDFF